MEAVDRFYRSYSKYLESYDEDTLFILLNSLHSLNDRLKSDHSVDLFGIEEFVVLKTIRNYIHHQDEMMNKLTSFPATKVQPIQTDLMFMCLIMKSDLDEAIEGIHKKYREAHKETIERIVHYYGSVVNLGPAIFNMAAKLMVLLDENDITGTSEDFIRNHDSMRFDIDNGHSITVSGRIYSHVNNVGKVETALLEAISH